MPAFSHIVIIVNDFPFIENEDYFRGILSRGLSKCTFFHEILDTVEFDKFQSIKVDEGSEYQANITSNYNIMIYQNFKLRNIMSELDKVYEIFVTSLKNGFETFNLCLATLSQTCIATGNIIFPDGCLNPSVIQNYLLDITSIDLSNLDVYFNFYLGVGNSNNISYWSSSLEKFKPGNENIKLAISTSFSKTSSDSEMSDQKFAEIFKLLHFKKYETPHRLNKDLNKSTIRVLSPCIYVFPEISGSSAILALPGYTLLIDFGGCYEPAFYNIASRLNSVDAALLTSWTTENVISLNSTLESIKGIENDYRSLKCILCPPPIPKKSETSQEENEKSFNLIQISKTTFHQNKTSMQFQQIDRQAKIGENPKSILLYQKAGDSKLEFIPLTPTSEDARHIDNLETIWKSESTKSIATTKVQLDKKSMNILSHLSVNGVLLLHNLTTKRQSCPLRVLTCSQNSNQLRVLTAMQALLSNSVYLRHSWGSNERAQTIPLVKGLDIKDPSSKPKNLPPPTAKPSKIPTRSSFSSNSKISLDSEKQLYAKFKPIYFDVCFVPGGGNPDYVSEEWFKFVRASYYICTTFYPPKKIIENIIAGRKNWPKEDSNINIHLIFCYETRDFRQFIHENCETLEKLHINIVGIVDLSTITLMDSSIQEASHQDNSIKCPGIRLDF